MLRAMAEESTGARARIMPSAVAGYALAVVVLAASLLLVFLYWRSAHARETEAARTEFAARADEASALLAQRLGSYELVARGGVSLFASVARPSRRQWQNYVDGLSLASRYPDLVGLGFATWSSAQQLSTLQWMLRESGEGQFNVWPHGVRDRYGPVLYLEPKTPGNVAAIGYDLYSEPVRRKAMDAARDSGQPRLSGQVALVQDQDVGNSALLLFLPVFRAGDRPASLAARRESMQGWVYVPFRMRQFVDATLRKTPHRVQLRIIDTSDGPGELLYADPPQPGGAAFETSTTLQAYGRKWRLEFRSEPPAVLSARMGNLRTTLGIGVLASLLLFGIALVLARTHSRAERLAVRMTESYRRSELRFRTAMEFSAIGKALLDRQGRIVEANPALARILSQTRKQLVGTMFESHFLDSGEQERRGHPLAGEPGVYRSTRTLLTGDGGLRQAQMTFAPVPGEIDQDIVRLVQVEDVTDRMRAEAQVLALNRTLEARVAARTRDLTIANQDLESFAYSVSHDLRAPLRAIDGFSRLLGERHGEQMDEEAREYLGRVRNAAARMGSLIEALLKMARLGRSGLKPADVDLGKMATEILAELRAGEPGREVATVVEPGLHGRGDPHLVRNLLQNLLGNAWKFTRGTEGARIEVGRDAQGAFFVRDNGAGFPAEYADKLFRPFQRLHSQAEFAGDGVGLATVRRIVERHGGTIRAEGATGEGAAFHFTLPQVAPDAD
jgi:PAS domain S-box-containing protein